MHIIILCDLARPSGGAQKVAIDSARALAEAGVGVTFIHAIPGADSSLDHPGIRCLCLDLADVWDLPVLRGAIAGIWNSATTRTLPDPLAAQRHLGPTLLHLHQWSRAFSPSVFSVARGSSLPLVVTAHDYFLACPNGVYYRFDQHNPCSLKPLSLGCLTAPCDPKSSAHKAVRLARSGVTAALTAALRFDVVHVSDRGRDILMPLLPQTLRHHRIDNPISLSPGPEAKIQPSAPFAYIGRLTREKGAIVAADAARRAGASIRFIGEGPAEGEIRAINPQADMLGWRSGADIAAQLTGGEIRAVVAPSLWYETGPLTVYEAASCGVAALASNRGGAAERVEHAVSGLVVEPSAQALAEAMQRLADDATAQSFGAAAYRRYWRDPPSPEAHAARLIALYESILSRGAPESAGPG